MLKKIINWFRGDMSALVLYKKIVEQALNPLYFTDMGVEDSVTGRFESIVLQLFLISNRLVADEGHKSHRIRALQEAFIMDMDRNLREMGVGDMSVGKQIKKMAAGWFGTAKAYEKALMSDTRAAEVEEVLINNLYRNKPEVPSAKMAAHVVALADHLKTVTVDQLYQENFSYPPFNNNSDTLI